MSNARSKPDSAIQAESVEPAPERRLRRLYLGSFGAVACLLILNQLLVQPQLLALAIDPPTLNRAGRQRMLSQRLVKAALAAERAGEGAERRRYLDELEEARASWTRAHEDLRATLPARSPEIRAGLRDLEPAFDRLRVAATRLVRSGAPAGADPNVARAGVDAILAEEAAYLRGMDRVVGLYEADARSRVGRLLWTGRLLTALSLLVVAGVGLLVIRPALRLIRLQFGELLRARSELEAKVRDRTQELEEVNRHLADEAGRRSLAESRHRAALEMASHASRINTLGEMAGGLAHELNQPLGAIANYAEGCLVALDRDDPDLSAVRSALGKLLAATLRAGAVIRRIRRFVTRGAREREPLDLQAALVEVADLLGDEAQRRRIALRVDAASDLPRVWGDPVQIQQVLINLVRNAFEAIDATEHSIRQVVMSAMLVDPEAIEVGVTDDGEGIDPERQDRIFEPYFSTRAEGMGMGLAICRTIVEAHGGNLAVESEPGVGSTFRFTLTTSDAGDDDGRHGLRR